MALHDAKASPTTNQRPVEYDDNQIPQYILQVANNKANAVDPQDRELCKANAIIGALLHQANLLRTSAEHAQNIRKTESDENNRKIRELKNKVGDLEEVVKAYERIVAHRLTPPTQGPTTEEMVRIAEKLVMLP